MRSCIVGWYGDQAELARNVVDGGLVEDFERAKKLPPACIPVVVGYGDLTDLPRNIVGGGLIEDFERAEKLPPA